MANHTKAIRCRLSLWLCSGLLLTSVGCGWHHGRYGGDTLFGNFNRPIAGTPPIWTGGDSGTSPANDGGVRLGMASPDVPSSRAAYTSGSLIMPTYQGHLGIGGFFQGGSSGTSNEKLPAPTPSSGGGVMLPKAIGWSIAGAQIQKSPVEISTNLYIPGQAAPLSGSTMATAFNNSPVGPFRGSAIDANEIQPKLLSLHERLKHADQVKNIEDGQSLLKTCGAKSMAINEEVTGDWKFSCILGDGSESRRYEARRPTALESVQAVLLQLQAEK